MGLVVRKMVCKTMCLMMMNMILKIPSLMMMSCNNENVLLDPVALSTAYKKMKSVCLIIRNEILTNIEIHKLYLLHSFMDLPNLSSTIYSTKLYNRLRAFLVSCPPSGPSPLVVELVISTADFQRDLCLWNVSYIKGGIDAKECFHVYITLWIEDSVNLTG